MNLQVTYRYKEEPVTRWADVIQGLSATGEMILCLMGYRHCDARDVAGERSARQEFQICANDACKRRQEQKLNRDSLKICSRIVRLFQLNRFVSIVTSHP